MTESPKRFRKRIRVRGVVQGVGFRPFVYRLAHEFDLDGWVCNTSWGVEIEVQGTRHSLERFGRALAEQAPPLSHIESLTAEDIPPNGHQPFTILESRSQEGAYQLISPDVATCSDCLREILDPADRRYRYPFTNCTNCGPRFTIIGDVPYDRPSTTMRDFTMCPDCQAEYDDPLDRRFHAQPNACPVCGPRVWLTDSKGVRCPVAGIDPVAEAARLLKEGHVLALKGLGGFHLACDATSDSAVQGLRERKRRPAKPLAVMVATLDEARRHCQVSPAEERLLTSHQCPIVLLRRNRSSSVSDLVAPGNRYLGVMLPYTPLHHILLRDVGRPLVMTSGNRSEEPIAIDNAEALHRLLGLADYYLMHNREIYARYDDSVWLVADLIGGQESTDEGVEPAVAAQPVRRSRGYAPYPITLPFRAAQTLACGAELKNTFCITREKYAFLSQHIGDMENLETLEHFDASVALLQRLFRVEPEIIVCDMHPDYLSTRRGQELAAQDPGRVKLLTAQHHHAHIASCLVDNGWSPEDGPVIGVAFDGTGFGLDRKVWGGEFLLADYRGFRRLAHLEYLPMPGGEAAIRDPYRLAVGYLYTLLGEIPSLPFLDAVPREELGLIRQQVEKGLNTPLTSAVGRLFDSVSAMLDICPRTTYEAQAAIELEMVADARWRGEGYPFAIEEEDGVWQIKLASTVSALIEAVRRRIPIGIISARFHETVVSMIAEVCQAARETQGIDTVALSGGCFQNQVLLRGAVSRLRALGFSPLVHHQVPCNDGGLSLGQAAIAQFDTASPKELSGAQEV